MLRKKYIDTSVKKREFSGCVEHTSELISLLILNAFLARDRFSPKMNPYHCNSFIIYNNEGNIYYC